MYASPGEKKEGEHPKYLQLSTRIVIFFICTLIFNLCLPTLSEIAEVYDYEC